MTAPSPAAELLLAFLAGGDAGTSAAAALRAVLLDHLAGAPPAVLTEAFAGLPLRLCPDGPQLLRPAVGLAEPQLTLAQVAAAWAQLAFTGSLDRVRLCAEPGCGRVFWDASPNHSRRWCSMRLCGNRTKQRRHHARWA
ncbi:CGNR zinc finger domain-containing protein [Streptacidiphilus monticola]|uniref:CGNR zinc finger domain-containing protein n=1 Tax=Streptacidiphilus monticola TaxID=2161674 RepID=A0ABW1G338_9ACTN